MLVDRFVGACSFVVGFCFVTFVFVFDVCDYCLVVVGYLVVYDMVVWIALLLVLLLVVGLCFTLVADLVYVFVDY